VAFLVQTVNHIVHAASAVHCVSTQNARFSSGSGAEMTHAIGACVHLPDRRRPCTIACQILSNRRREQLLCSAHRGVLGAGGRQPQFSS
jgi:hypothetical protein